MLPFCIKISNSIFSFLKANVIGQIDGADDTSDEEDENDFQNNDDDHDDDNDDQNEDDIGEEDEVRERYFDC